MRVECSIGMGLVAAVLASASVAAFEPGKPRVCEPSADGQRFECHERDAAGQPTTPSSPPLPTVTPPTSVDTPAATPPPPTASTSSTAEASTAASGSRALPNYLLQTPARAASAPATADAPREVVAAAPAATPAKTASAATASAPAPAIGEATVDSSADVTVPATPALRESDVAPPAETPHSATPIVSSTPAPTHAATLRPRDVARADAFRRLASTRYTVELAQAERPGAFDALLAALANVEGAFYVVSLRGPERRTWHLLWSDFASIEDARAARLGLPANAAIPSGWPRRIGPLRAELDAP